MRVGRRGYLQHTAVWDIVVGLLGLAGAARRANDAHEGAGGVSAWPPHCSAQSPARGPARSSLVRGKASC